MVGLHTGTAYAYAALQLVSCTQGRVEAQRIALAVRSASIVIVLSRGEANFPWLTQRGCQ